MPPATQVEIGRIRLKNPLIAGSAKHLIEADGVRAALRAGAGAVVVKSTNRSQAARDQLQRAEYMVLDADWRPVAWGPQTPAHACIACRSGLTPQSFDAWLAQTIELDREAKALDAYAVASLIFDEIGSTVEMARAVEQAGNPRARAQHRNALRQPGGKRRCLYRAGIPPASPRSSRR